MDKEEWGRSLHHWTNLRLKNKCISIRVIIKKIFLEISQNVGNGFYNKCIYQIGRRWLFMTCLH